MLLQPFNLKSDRNMKVVCRAKIEAIFLVCLGQFVETLRELPFCALNVKWANVDNTATLVALT
jgi:hypothetical protein